MLHRPNTFKYQPWRRMRTRRTTPQLKHALEAFIEAVTLDELEWWSDLPKVLHDSVTEAAPTPPPEPYFPL